MTPTRTYRRAKMKRNLVKRREVRSKILVKRVAKTKRTRSTTTTTMRRRMRSPASRRFSLNLEFH
jgi:hypothetical protein